MAKLEEINETGLEIAVIGMAGKFPGAENIHQFWENLKQGLESIPFFNDEELQQAGAAPDMTTGSGLIKSNGSLLENIEYFDAAFFGYTPMEAQQMAPQIRIFHECLWEALEDAGCDPEQESMLIGLYAGASSTSNWEFLCSRAQAGAEIDTFVSRYLSNRDFISTLISYKMNLKGPGFFMNSACSTSLAAVHLACQGLLCSDCDMAAAGGITLSLNERRGYFYQEGMISSPDGHCRTFDKKAGGTVGGEGAGVVVLKRQEDAINARDHIYAIIKGSAVNNDGNRKVGFTAPSIEGQVEVIRKAMVMAEVKPETISYIEAHGTGTPLGDSSELEALKSAFNTREKHFCGLGAVKTNIGHLDAAAGVAGLIKAVLSIKYKQLTPTLHFETPNPRMNLENSPFYIIKELKPWHHNGRPLRAGVSSFGIGGTNVHVILEEFPLSNEEIPGAGGGPPDPPLKSRDYQLIVLSAKTPSALDKITGNLAAYLKDNPGIDPADVAYTLQSGRKSWPYRRKLVCSDVSEAAAALTALDPRKLQTHLLEKGSEKKSIIFLFPGLGSQYVNMGREVYQTEPAFRQEMDRCFGILKGLLPYDIKDILYPGDSGSEERGECRCPDNRSPGSYKSYNINDFEVAQLVIFIFQYSLARLLMSWGIQPQALMGYSFGEYTAACLSGVFTLEHALELLITRGKLMGELPSGMMLNVPLSTKEVLPLLGDGLGIGIDNGASCVVSGGLAAVKAFAKKMKQQKVMCMPLDSGHGIHSSHMAPIVEKFVKAIESIPLHDPKIPFISSLTGSWIIPRDVVSHTYWGRQMRETVRFAAGIQKLLNEPGSICLEVGAGRELSALVNREKQRKGKNKEKPHVVHLVRPKNVKKEIPDAYYLLDKIGLLWLYGVSVDWRAYYAAEARRRVSLPTYPFERQRFWKLVEDYQGGNDWTKTGQPGQEPKPGQQNRNTGAAGELTDWFYVPTWMRKELPPTYPANKTGDIQLTWMIFMDTCGIGDGILRQLEASNHYQLIKVKKGPGYEKGMKGEYAIHPREAEHYRLLLEDIQSAGFKPQRILHLWGIGANNSREASDESGLRAVIAGALENGFYSLLYLAKALGRSQPSADKIDIRVVTNHMQDVTGEEELEPGKAAVLGLCRVIPQEYPYISCKSIDIGNRETPGLEEQLAAEMIAETTDPITVLRGRRRWVQTFQTLPRQEVENTAAPSLLRRQGVYLITGGLGNIGNILAEYLIKRVNARVILTGRTPLPPPETWGQFMILANKEDKIYQCIEKMQRLREMDREVLYTCADVSDPWEMTEALRRGEERFGPIHGIIHAAGIVSGESFNPTAEITGDQCKLQFSSKIEGMVVLEELVKDKKLDFCLMISSISTVLGGLGFAAYAAANHFLDAFSLHRRKKRQEPWIIVDWDGTNPEETARAFDYILALGTFPQVIFSRGGDLEGRIARWVKLEGLNRQVKEEPGEKGKPAPPAPLYSRPELSNPYVAPGSPLERQLADIWQRFFGIEKIGIKDDLYDLGGDSLKAINIISIIHKELGVVIPIKEFFDNSTIQGAAQYISGTEKQEFVPIVPAEKKEYYELSSNQKRLYFLQALEKTGVVYNSPQVLLLEGRLDKEHLEQVVRQMIKRHESFRTSIRAIDTEPVQVVHHAADIYFAVEYEDIEVLMKGPGSDSGPGSQPAAAFISSFIRPFDLSKAPLLRVGLLKVAAHRHILMFDLHHIVTDGISNEIMVKEFNALHEGKLLSPIYLQYKDYVEWLNNPRQQVVLAKQGTYWQQQFQGEIPVLDLPWDYPRPVMQSFAGDEVNFELSAGETRALNAVASSVGATLFMALAAVFNILLSKLSGQEEIIIGTPVACRMHADLEKIVGMFVNTLALRNYPAGHRTFREFLADVKEKNLMAFENQEYPFEGLVDKLSLTRDIGRNPLFDIMFVMQNMEADIQDPDKETRLENRQPVQPGIPQEYENINLTAKFDLTLTVAERNRVLFLSFQYCTKLFKKETIERFIIYFKKIVSMAVKEPGIRINEIEILAEEEKNRLLYEFNDTGVDYPKDKTIRQLFEEQVENTPHRVALVGKITNYKLQITNQETPFGQVLNAFGGMVIPDDGPDLTVPAVQPVRFVRPVQLTYRQLNEQSNRLAGWLIEKGVQSDTVVGIMVERSLEMIIGIWGILKSGGAYMPIDPDYPEERINYMLKDSSAGVLVTTPKLQVKVKTEVEEKSRQPGLPLQFIHINTNLAFSSEPSPLTSTSTLTCQVSPANLAYIIYTSGSTGRPKGVMVKKEGFLNLLRWYIEEFGFGKEDNNLLIAPISFDLSQKNLFSPFLTGGRLTLASPGIPDYRELAAIIQEEFVTVINCAPSVFYPLFEANDNADFTALHSLRTVILGGEAILADRLFSWVNSGSFHCEIINTYGPTECTDIAAYHRISRESFLLQKEIPIGKPIPNVKVYILDKYLQVLPMRIPGELCIGGIGFSRGYSNNISLTQEKFFTAPHLPTKRVYRTGDLTRWLPDGNIQFLGRIDQQVKIRGSRIELEEIESQLLKYQKIKEAVVMSRPGETGDNYLCAYFVPHMEEQLSASDLREYLGQRLPDYMIPSYFVPLERIPLSPNGKLDRRALPKPELKTGQIYTAPGNVIEKKLVGIWSEVLGRDELHTSQLQKSIGISDNFFQLGGHSLKATILVSKIHKAFDVKVPLAEIFIRSTIRGLAEYISEEVEDKYLSIRPLEEKEYCQLSSAQQRLYFLWQLEPDSMTYNIPLTITLPEEVHPGKLEEVFRKLIKRHDSLRTSFHMIGDQPVQRIHDHVEFAMEYDRSLVNCQGRGEAPSPVKVEKIIRDFIRPFDLSRAPLLRGGLLGPLHTPSTLQGHHSQEGKENQYLLMVDMHHIITDGLSMEILEQDFMTLYKDGKLPSLEIQYKDFALWQNSSKENEELKRQELYWLKEFTGEIPVLNIPADYPRPLMQSHEGNSISFEISARETRALMAMALKESATLFMVLAAVLNILLAKLCHQEDIVIGTPVAGRRHADLEKIIGMFVNTLALRNYPYGEKSFTGFLQELKERALSAFENQEYQFEDLVEKVVSSRDMGRNPLFDVSFQDINSFPAGGFANRKDETGTIDKPQPISEGDGDYLYAAKFDLEIIALEQGEKLKIFFGYCTKLFSKETILRFMRYFKQIISSVIREPGKRIMELEIISPEERQQLLFDLNRTGVDYAKEKTIHQLFAEQVEQTPDYIALVGASGGQGARPQNRPLDPQKTFYYLTYHQLNEQSDRLAGWLIERGVQSDIIVGIMVERSLEMIIGILGILKSGGAYLPIDPGYPRERIDYMLEDSGAKILLTGPEITGPYSPPAFDKGPKGTPVRLHLSPAPAASLAYLIYTSGSTGKPKGVMIEHRALHNFMEGIAGIIRFRPGKTILALTTITFDIFGLETLLPLCRGLKLIMATENHQQELRLLEQLIIRNCVDMLQATPTRMQMFTIGGAAPSCLKDLKEIMVGGEAFPLKLLEDLRRSGSARIYNMYGPTETTIWSSTAELTAAEKITIGRPIANTQIYILNQYSKIQPPGVAGELHIGGDGVARGYLNNPQLTAEKFDHDLLRDYREYRDGYHRPYKSYKSYIYRTGDLARWLPDGNIEFLGRIDHQLKLRGFRIEPGEIENRLSAYPGIKETVVLMQEEEKGDKYLCAYIAADDEKVISGLREYLAKELPDYMIPTYFVRMENIPLTSSGKIDRKALPKPKLKIGETYTAPKNEIEKKLVRLWAEILAGDELQSLQLQSSIGTEDNFFRLGGHSLKATILSARIEKAFNIKIPLAEIFKHPKINELSEYIKRAASRKYEQIEAVEKQEYYALSSAQKRLYFLWQLEPDSVTYNIPLIITLPEELHPEKLAEVSSRLIKRHDSLRTSFQLMGDQPVQRIHDHVEFEIEHFLATGDTENAEDAEDTGDTGNKSLIASFIRPFDLTQAPLLRVGLIGPLHTPPTLRGHPSQKGKENQYLLVADMHHIITDGLSMEILEQDFMALYKDGKLPSLEIQYKDFALWQNSSKENEEIKQQELYWLKEFTGEIPVLNIPTDYPRPLMQGHEGNSLGFEISARETQALMAMALKESATLFMVLAAVLNILLAKLCRQEDIVIGTPVAGRRHADLEKIIGMFVNTLALRNYPYGEKSFSRFLQELKERALAAFENQEYQFEDLVEKVVINRDMGRNPLFDVSLQDINRLLGGGFANRTVETGTIDKPEPISEGDGNNLHIAKFDLEITALEQGEKLKIFFGYCTKLFRKETILGFIRYFKQIISSVIREPGKRIMEIEIISPEERQRLLFDLNRTGVDYAKEKTIHQLFAEQVEQTPDYIALVGASGGQGAFLKNRPLDPQKTFYYLTYHELNEQSDRLAGWLIERGVQSDIIVGIMVERSLEMIIGILGILKSGGAYLPIDPEYPRERIDHMLKDSGAGVLVTTPKLQVKVKTEVEEKSSQPGLPLQFIHINTNLAFSSEPSLLTLTSTLTCQVNPANLAYIIYTSGSTGRPRGVMVEHRNVLRLVNNCNYIHFSPGDRLLPTGSPAFDISTFEIWGPLCNGMMICLATKDTLLNAEKLKETLLNHNISILHLIPQLFKQLAAIDIGLFAGLRYFLVGGDRVPPAYVNALRQKYSHLKILHMYGPTENTTFSTFFPVDRDYEYNIPIGLPISNSTVFIFDKYGQLQPVGLTGELCLGGEGLARGYLNRPELTAEKFAPPITLITQIDDSKKAPLLYHTGDLARWLPEGNIEFMGRKDNQIKIRGFRVEPGEIENRLSKHPHIKESVAAAKETPGTEGVRIAAYIVSDKVIETGEIREFLADQLPDFMIPSYFVRLDNIPLTPTGKVDRNKLPEPVFVTGKEYKGPRNENETKLVKIWSEILGRDQLHASQLQTSIGIDDNFFQLGGHSLNAAILIARIHKAFDVKIPLANIFKMPTIRELSGYIEHTEEEPHAEIAPIEKREYYVLSSPQQRLYFLRQLDNTGTAYNITSAWILAGAVDRNSLERSIVRLIERHESLRTSFELINGTPAQRIHDHIAFEIEYYNSAPDYPDYPDEKKDTANIEAQSKVLAGGDGCFKGRFFQKEPGEISGPPEAIIKNFIRPFDLSRVPLLRVGLIKLPHIPAAPGSRPSQEGIEHKYILVVDMHHIIADGVSMQVLAQDFSALYPGKELTGMKLQYKDYAQWQNQERISKNIREQGEYWKKEFAGEIPVLAMPTDYARPAVQGFEGNRINSEINKEISGALKALALETGTTLYIVLLAIYTIFLARLTGKEDIVIGTPVAGRRHDDLEKIIGMFVNTLPLRNYSSGNKTFIAFLAEVKERTLKALDNQDYQYEDLVEQVVKNRDASRNPLFDTMFALQNTASRKIEFPGLKLGPYKSENKTAIFDISLTVGELEENLVITFEYNTQLFKPDTIERFMDFFRQIISIILNNREIKIEEIEISHHYTEVGTNVFSTDLGDFESMFPGT